MAEIKDVVIIILILTVITTSTFSFYLYYHESDSDGNDVNESIKSVLEITCWDDESDTVCGTGFVIEHEGAYVLTNSHMVIKEKDGFNHSYSNIIGKFANNNTKYELEIVNYDTSKDIALLCFKENIQDKPLLFQTERPEYGDAVTVIGNAMGYGLSVKRGVVSVPELNMVYKGETKNVIMISLTINHGDSGSPIINNEGKVIGMSSFKMKEEGVAIEGMSYGLTVKTIIDFLDNLNSFTDNTVLDC